MPVTPPDPLAAASADLESVADRPLEEQVAIFERIHHAVSDALDQAAHPSRLSDHES